MNNGTNALTSHINSIIPFLPMLKKYKFYISSNIPEKLKKKIEKKTKNIIFINNSLKKMYSYISLVDLVVARGGYNTVTECLIFKKASILTSEKLNPEVERNIFELKRKKLCGVMIDKDWQYKSFKKKIENFVKKDYDFILKNIKKNKFKNNGSSQIVKDITMELKKND